MPRLVFVHLIYVTIVLKRHTLTTRQITSHDITYDILYVVLFGLLLGCTVHGRVVNGHTVLPCTRSEAYGLNVLRPRQAFYDKIYVSVYYCSRFFR